MTNYQPFYIANYETDSGKNTYFEPFLIPEKAFPKLENAYCWRGRVRKKLGNDLLGRLRRTFTAPVTLSTQANGAAYVKADILADAAFGLRATEPNAEIQPGTLAITVGAVTFTDNGDGTLTGNPITNTGTINYITGALTLAFNPALGGATNVDVTFSYFPALPVTGLPTRIELSISINVDQLVAFDTKYAYRFNGVNFEELPSVAPTTWQGSSFNLFWTTNYFLKNNANLFWATNFNKGANPDPIRYYDGTTWATFNPVVNGANRLQQCKILIPYKGRLLALNTWEGANLAAATNFPQRIRFSQAGDPTDLVNGWLDSTAGRGGFIDASTNESIVTAYFVKDVLVIKFERSSWRLVYTGNEVKPFEVQKTNAEFGAISTFSFIPFDTGVLTVSNQGVTTDSSVNVDRIDQVIPQQLDEFALQNNGFERIYGVRDFNNQLALWSYSDSDLEATFPNRILLYNYVNNTFATLIDSYTAFGTFNFSADPTWATLEYPTWTVWTAPWGSTNNNTGSINVVGGNQQGYVMVLQMDEKSENDTSLSITAINGAVTPARFTVPNHNLVDGDVIYLSDIIATGVPDLEQYNDIFCLVIVIDANTITLEEFDNGDFISIDPGPGGTYLGNGKLTRIDNFNITTKVFSPFYESAQSTRIGFVDFFVDKTEGGAITVNCFVDENDTQAINDPASPNNVGLIGNNVLSTAPNAAFPFQANQQKLWQRLQVNANCQNYYLELTMTPEQLCTAESGTADFVLHALNMWLCPTGRLVQ